MVRSADLPIVSFARDGQVFELGRSGRDPIMLMHGMQGVGLAPVEHKSFERSGGDGNIHVGSRYGAREVFLPFLVTAPTLAEVTRIRQGLNRLVAPHLGAVEVRVQDPATGTDRMILGRYKDGLEGDLGDGYAGVWQKFGITFDCPDPWWLGPERLRTLRLAPGSKPFLSQTVPFFPVTLAASSVLGEWDVDIEGDGEVWPSWEVTGPGRDLTIESGDSRIFIEGTLAAGETIMIQTRPRRISPVGMWQRTSLDSKLFPLKPGSNRIRASMVNASAATTIRLVWRERYLEGV